MLGLYPLCVCVRALYILCLGFWCLEQRNLRRAGDLFGCWWLCGAWTVSELPSQRQQANDQTETRRDVEADGGVMVVVDGRDCEAGQGRGFLGSAQLARLNYLA